MGAGGGKIADVSVGGGETGLCLDGGGQEG